MISELQQKLCSEVTYEQDGTITESVVEPALSGKELPGLITSQSNTTEVTRPADNSEAFCLVPSSNAPTAAVCHVTDVVSPAENSGSDKGMEDRMSEEKRLNKDSRSDQWCASVGVRGCGEGDDETRDGEADVTGMEEWRGLGSRGEGGGGAMLSGVGHGGLGSGGQVMPGVRDELQTALAQLEEEEKRWEMELASQQKEREVSEWAVKFRKYLQCTV